LEERTTGMMSSVTIMYCMNYNVSLYGYHVSYKEQEVTEEIEETEGASSRVVDLVDQGR